MAERRERGALESAVMRRLWDEVSGRTSRELRESFEPQERPALTTLLTVLDRLEAKGLVVREAGERSTVFRAARSESTHAADAMASALNSVRDRRAVLLSFAGSLTDADADALRAAIEGSR